MVSLTHSSLDRSADCYGGCHRIAEQINDAVIKALQREAKVVFYVMNINAFGIGLGGWC